MNCFLPQLSVREVAGTDLASLLTGASVSRDSRVPIVEKASHQNWTKAEIKPRFWKSHLNLINSGNQILVAFISAVCSPMCLNGGKCLRGNKCRCKRDFTGQYCELKNRYYNHLMQSLYLSPLYLGEYCLVIPETIEYLRLRAVLGSFRDSQIALHLLILRAGDFIES